MGHVSIIKARAGNTILYIIAAPKVGKRESGKWENGKFPSGFFPGSGKRGEKVVVSRYFLNYLPPFCKDVFLGVCKYDLMSLCHNYWTRLSLMLIVTLQQALQNSSP